MAARPRVFSVPPSAPFLPALIAALMEGRLVAGFPDRGDPLALSRATLYLPTRRACRLARDLFLDLLGADALLLPRLVAIGDVDEDELIFAAAAGPLGEQALALPPALDLLDRRLMLARLVLQWARSPAMRRGPRASLVAGGPAAALALAGDLGRLIDDMITREVSWSRLDGLVPDHVDEYWQKTLDFLKVVHGGWSAILAERGVIEAAERRDLLIAAEAERLAVQADGPVIAAGSTASMPATAKLLEAIARLPQGAVVLPGLDLRLDEESWRLIGGDAANVPPAVVHPQYGMHGFLARLGMSRAEVEEIGAPEAPQRDRLVSEALRPAAATHLWAEQAGGGHAVAALARVSVVDAANAEDEALAIAVALREAAEASGKRAALVTPDRALARRVIAALRRWDVAVDDSGGESLADTPAGVFARLVAEAALGGTEPVTLLALLKHPSFSLGTGAHAAACAALERAVLRGPRPRPGTAGLAHALATLAATRENLHPADPRAGLAEMELGRASDLVRALAAALGPMEALGKGAHPLAAIAGRHHATLAALAGPGAADLDAVLALLERLAASEAAAGLEVAPLDYAEIVQTAMAGEIVRGPADPQAPVRILGLLEARLQPLDRVVLGGLVEGVWPPQTRSDPWLSRPMRRELGLDLPERRIGLTAHDFAQAMGVPEVILTRAAKVGGAPTVPSRFVQRLAAVAGREAWDAACRRGADYLALARRLDAVERAPPLAAPAPRPPLDARPKRLSVTEIEHLLRDPYTIYAKRILRLAPLDPVDTPPGPRDRGSAVHAAIEEFTEAFAGGLPEDPHAALLAIGRRHFAPLADYPEAQAFWWPRYERIAAWFAAWEAARRPGIAELLPEVDGAVEIPTAAGAVKLTARADRIERLPDGAYALLDFKTGLAPTDRQVAAGLSPQLTLEAAILRRGGFAGIAAGAAVAELAYVSLRGGDPAGECRTVAFKDSDAETEADRAFGRLCGVLARFAEADTPYRSMVHPMWSTRYGDYDHLARVREWSLAGSDGDAEVEP